eukprot:UN03700
MVARKYTVALVVVAMIIACIAMVSAAPPKAHELTSDYSFEQYLQDFPEVIEQHKLTANSFEYANRKTIFEAELKRVMEHNAKNLPWKLGINKFSHMTEEEFYKQYTGEFVHPEGLKAVAQPNPDDLIASQDFPESIDWDARNFMPREIRNQGSCGSCYAHQGLSVLEFYLKAKAGKEIILAPQQPVDCFVNERHCGGTGGCHGATGALIMGEYASKYGIMQEKDYPYVSGQTKEANPECSYDPSKIVVKTTGARRIPPNNVNALMQALVQGVVGVSVDASGGNGGWKAYESGVMMNTTRGYVEKYKTYEVTLNHAVTLVGASVTKDGIGYWKVRNSWGPSWGQNGHIYLYRPTNGEPEQTYIDMDPQSGSACDGDDMSPFYVAGSAGILYNPWVPEGVEYIPQP